MQKKLTLKQLKLTLKLLLTKTKKLALKKLPLLKKLLQLKLLLKLPLLKLPLLSNQRESTKKNILPSGGIFFLMYKNISLILLHNNNQFFKTI